MFWSSGLGIFIAIVGVFGIYGLMFLILDYKKDK